MGVVAPCSLVFAGGRNIPAEQFSGDSGAVIALCGKLEDKLHNGSGFRVRLHSAIGAFTVAVRTDFALILTALHLGIFRALGLDGHIAAVILADKILESNIHAAGIALEIVGVKIVADGNKPGMEQRKHTLNEVAGFNAVSRHLARERLLVQSPSPTGRTGTFLNQVHQPFNGCFLQLGGITIDKHPVKVVRNAIHLFAQPLAVRGIRTIEQVVAFVTGEILPLFVQRKQTRFSVLPPVPVAYMESRQINHALVPRLIRVDAFFNINHHDLTDAGTLRTHTVGIVERKIGGCTHIWFSNSGIEQPQSGIHIADGAHGGAGVATQPGLIHNDGSGKVVNLFHLGLETIPKFV